MIRQKDYLIRLIEEFAQVLAAMLGLKERRNYKELYEYARKQYLPYTGLTATQLAALPTEGFAKTLLEQVPELSTPQLEVLATLLLHEGDACYELGEAAASRHRLQQALDLYQYLETADAKIVSLVRRQRMQQIHLLLQHLNA
ncbi:hypothetical protein [Eisenibacter elegans]|uniref:hypothetical protein n=1 Tax=Eisenibacter elegans TaxID=997 RepID=UPI00040AEE1D|nr:hypothetical protein [Eisenibacter elegans]